MCITSDYLDEWAYNHCECNISGIVSDQSNIELFKPYYRCLDCGRERYDELIECNYNNELTCECGSTNLEHIDCAE